MMSPALTGLISALAAAVVAGLASSFIVLYQTERGARIERRRRAFEQHVEQYTQVFVSARTALESLDDYMRIMSKIANASDPFAEMLLSIVRISFNEYMRSVDWRYHPGMVHLDEKIERRALNVARLMQDWLSVPHTRYGTVLYAVVDGRPKEVSRKQLPQLRDGAPAEVRVERQLLVSYTSKDASRGRTIAVELRKLIHEVKMVLAV